MKNNVINNKIINNNPNKRIIYKPVGLENVGATCYMNATLQCLSHCDELSKNLLIPSKFQEYKNFSDIFPLTYAYANVIKNLFPSSNFHSYFKPIHFKNTIGNLNPLFKEFAANDSKDLLIFILEKIHLEIKIPKEIKNNINQNININSKEGQFLIFMNQFNAENTSIISNNFYGINESTIKCLNCGFSTYNFNIFNFIIFPLEEARKFCLKKGELLIMNQRVKSFIQLLNNANKKKITLEDCFEYNQNVDILKGENSIFCNHCHRSSNAYMYPKIFFTPKILCIVLNRGRGNIYHVNIDYPEYFNISKFVSPFALYKEYELIGVITHFGESGSGGHFIAICKSRIDKKWYLFNDQTVTKSSYKDALNKGTPYILFYHAKF